MSTYSELLDRIASLQAQAKMVRALERQQAIESILALMEQHGLTPADLRSRRKRKN